LGQIVAEQEKEIEKLNEESSRQEEELRKINIKESEQALSRMRGVSNALRSKGHRGSLMEVYEPHALSREKSFSFSSKRVQKSFPSRHETIREEDDEEVQQ
jgi:hypothetical protein